MTTATLIKPKPIQCNSRLLYERLNLGIYIPIQDISIEEGVSDLIYRAWQQECFNACKASEKQHWIVNAPTGSGKSNILLGLAIDALKNDKNHLVILACPQKEIGKGFFKRIWKIDGIDTTIRDNNQLCGDKLFTDTGKVKRLKDFIEGKRLPHETDRMIVCTHATLSFVLERVDKAKMKNITLIIDEGHHIRTDDVNGLGKVANYFLDNDFNKLNLIVSSATHFRGDRGQIIPFDKLDRFYTFHLNYDRHLIENCNGLTFSFEFFFNHKGRGNAHTINTIFQRTGIRKTIIFIPRSGTRYSHERDKKGDFDEVIRGISNTNRATFTWDLKTTTNGVHIVKLVNRNGKMIRVLDLVMEEGRNTRLDYLRSNPDAIDIVIGINVPKEGFDWTVATREIIIGKIGSLPEMIQIIGRCFRQHHTKDNGKTKVEIIQIFPKVDIEKLDKNKITDNFNDFAKAIYIVLAGRLVLNPIDIKLPMEIKRKNGLKSIDTVSDYLLEKLDGTQFEQLFDNVSNDMWKWSINNKNHTEEQYLNKLQDVVTTRAAEVGIHEFQEEIAQYLHKTWESSSEAMSDKPITEDDMISNINGIDINDINITLVKPYKNPIYKTLEGCFHEHGDGMTMQEFNKLLVPVDTLRRLYVLKEFVEKNGRYPSGDSDDIEDSDEVSLAWFEDSIKKAKKGLGTYILTDEHIEVAESIPNWKWHCDDDTEIQCYELQDWMNANNGKIPSERSKDPLEARLGRFYSRARLCINDTTGKYVWKFNEKHKAILNNIPNITWNRKYDDQINKANTCKAWVIANEYPKHDTKDADELKLYKYISNTRTSFRKGKIIDDVKLILESIPNWTWDFHDDKKAEHIEKAKKIVEYYITTGNTIGDYMRGKTDEQKNLRKHYNNRCEIKRGKERGVISDEEDAIYSVLPDWPKTL